MADKAYTKLQLAMMAGAYAIGNNKNFLFGDYVYDLFGEEGGPHRISWHDAEKILFCTAHNLDPDKYDIKRGDK